MDISWEAQGAAKVCSERVIRDANASVRQIAALPDPQQRPAKDLRQAANVALFRLNHLRHLSEC